MARMNEVTGKVNETLVPQLRKLPVSPATT